MTAAADDTAFGISTGAKGQAELSGVAALGANVAMVGHLLNAIREPGIKILLITPQSKPVIEAALMLAAADVKKAIDASRDEQKAALDRARMAERHVEQLRAEINARNERIVAMAKQLPSRKAKRRASR